MKFEKHDLSDGMRIPAAAMKICGFDPGEPAEYYTLDNAAVVLKKQMTASEVVKAAWSLHKLSAELCFRLTDLCCLCDDCGKCCGEPLQRDIPAPIIQAFHAAGLCPAGLEKLLKTGEIVYGK